MKLPARHRYKFIGCEIVYREVCHLVAASPNIVDIEFLPKGLHSLETPDMVARVQAAVDAVAPDREYEAILLGYARCNDGVVGVRARDLPLVIPRAHDCVTLFLGSRAEYRRYFDEHPGTYYMTTGWKERDAENDQELLAQGTVSGKLGLRMPYEEMVERYGRENADFIRETMGDTRKNYSRYLYLRMGVCPEDDYVDETRRDAADRDWTMDVREGDLGLLARMFAGEWDDDFVVVPPGGVIVARNDERVLGCE